MIHPIPPRGIPASAGPYLRLCLALVRELERRSPAAQQPLILRAAREVLQPPPVATPLAQLGLPTTVCHALHRAGYSAIEQVAALTPEQLGRIKRLGPRGLTTVQAALTAWLHPNPLPSDE